MLDFSYILFSGMLAYSSYTNLCVFLPPNALLHLWGKQANIDEKKKRILASDRKQAIS